MAPAQALAQRPRLFAALEAALPVSFAGRAAGELNGLDALLAFGEAAEPVAARPSPACRR